jgi:hypothetical protein
MIDIGCELEISRILRIETLTSHAFTLYEISLALCASSGFPGHPVDLACRQALMVR